uniref:DBH-like monooxygenase protein 1 homolog n=1 Tax=Dermatophagoides pteronyssinus TaxID=6956 RepID=A0A6P6YKU8_DERPT|nr:DBH-like monooxygenase protein 1 homolog [Dermatophagoides pteronyssinus]
MDKLFLKFLIIWLSFYNVGHHCRLYEWMHQIVLDSNNKYHLKWLFNMKQELIVFNVCIQTHGWFGLGISHNGHMTGSDIVIGWVDQSGRVHLQDRFAEDEEMPVIDDKQDWLLESGYENDTHTCITFSRPFLTCDYDGDLPITNDVTKLIWAYNDDDPIGYSAVLSKHSHYQRGHKSVHLLNYKFDDNHFEHSMKMNSNDKYSTKIKSWDITSKNFTISHESDTTYWCKIVSPSFRSKAHVIRIEPIISPQQNAPFVHHMVLYRCLHPNPELMREYLDQPGINCLDFANMPFDFFHCQSIYMVWTTGGEAFNLPDNVGIPIFEDHETTYFMFEIHYDNPELKANIQDSSGLRLYYTEKLRKFDADTATMGSVVDYRLIIPNGFENFTVSGHCSPECFRQKIPVTGLNVLAALPHGHKHLKRIVVRHFRGHDELPPLAEENNYDFNFQDFRRFNERRIILPGDQITVECTYNTESLKRPILGGLSTQEEMCMVFLVYYPRMKGVRTCLSGLTPETVMKLSNIDQVQKLDENDMNPVIIQPLEHANQTLSTYVLTKEDWHIPKQTLFDIGNLTNLIRYAPQKAQCFWRKIEGIDGLEGMDEINELITYPKLYRPYEKPKTKCHPVINSHIIPPRFISSSSSLSLSSLFKYLIFILIIIIINIF